MPMDESNVAFGHNGVARPDDDFNPGDMPENTREENEILTVSEVSKLLKLHQRTIYKLAQTGMISGWKVGKSWRFLRSAIIKRFEKKDV
jgi:excisionase family DNA binding protein